MALGPYLVGLVHLGSGLARGVTSSEASYTKAFEKSTYSSRSGEKVMSLMAQSASSLTTIPGKIITKIITIIIIVIVIINITNFMNITIIVIIIVIILIILCKHHRHHHHQVLISHRKEE